MRKVILIAALALAAPAFAQPAKPQTDARVQAYAQLLAEANDRIALLSEQLAKVQAENAQLRQAAQKAPQEKK